MQSKKPHKLLFKELLEHTSRVKMAIHDGDAEALKLLAREHSYLMDEMNQAGLTTDMDLLGLIEELNNQVGEVIAEIKEKRDETGMELRKFVKRKETIRAYASAIYSMNHGQMKSNNARLCRTLG